MQTIIVYTGTFFLMLISAILYKKGGLSINIDTKIKHWDIIMILIFVIVFGMRYNVGIDYPAYKLDYEYGDFERYEFLFKFISEYLSNNGYHVVIYFSIWCFLQIFLLLKAFKDEKYIYPALIFVLFTGQYFLLWMNVIRQDVAACVLIFSIKYIVNKNVCKYLFCIIFAYGFHKSAIILLLLYPIFQIKKEYFNHVRFQLALYVLVVFFSFRFSTQLSNIESFLFSTIEFLSFDDVYGSIDLEKYTTEIVTGGTFVLNLIIDIIIILNSNKVKQFYKNERLYIFYDLYFVGAIINTLLMSSFLLSRPFRYFRFFEMIVSAFLICYLYKNRKEKMNVLLFIVLLLSYMLLYITIFRDDVYKYQMIEL